LLLLCENEKKGDINPKSQSQSLVTYCTIHMKFFKSQVKVERWEVEKGRGEIEKRD
jgi:hypothetical protein